MDRIFLRFTFISPFMIYHAFASLPCQTFRFFVSFSKRIILFNAKASYVVQSLNLSNHKAQSEVWNIAGWTNGSWARCENKWHPPPIRDKHHTPGLGVTTKHWDQRKLNFKQTVSEFIPEMWILNGLGMWGAWWREECCGWSAYLSPLFTHSSFPWDQTPGRV